MEDIENLKLEILALQQRDTQLAQNNGINSKDKWLMECLKADTDEIAAAIIDISTRYNIPVANISNLFDETMILRVVKQQNRNKNIKKDK